MAKCRVIERIDRSLAIIHVMPNKKRPKETDKQYLSRVLAKSQSLKKLPYYDIEENKLPNYSNNTFDRWVMSVDKKKVVEDDSIVTGYEIVEEINNEIEKSDPDVKKIFRLKNKLRIVDKINEEHDKIKQDKDKLISLRNKLKKETI